ncbi:GNAT family N-acetyltransferase [Mucilaginibacter xinganensis]|uniref:GNAT family N-acetyltransferase n=1 Tax=Mucilaginibacter xinganensis TaxID=1234841 RepID=A0A223NR11_9SPHI|nr:GNAT family N-acetyltransferase [Mucilaginibacter xinganensis]ASU32303.1 GNAT family N-acetyltransferase [Mucilaginibacter xinganensis]
MQNLTLKRTDSDDPDFRTLVISLDCDLELRYGAQQSFFNQFNKLDKIKNVVVAYWGNVAVGCGALRAYNDTEMEVKRMFVASEHRGKGIAKQLLNELEAWAVTLQFKKCILETGTNQPEAINLYLKCGYEITEAYGNYIGVENSICMSKVLT